MKLLFSILTVLGLLGKIDTVRIESCDSIPLYMTVYTPPSYTPDSVYSVLYLLHGIHGNQFSWQDQAYVCNRADSLIKHHIIRPVVMVMPLCVVNDSTYATHIPNYCRCMHDYLHHSKKREFEPYFADIQTYAESHYSIVSPRPFAAEGDLAAIAGLSSGARQALNIGRDGHFAIVGLFSPVISRRQLPIEDGGTTYWIRCGSNDLFYTWSRRANRKLNRRHIPHNYSKTSGSHNWKNWNRYIDEFLKYTFPYPSTDAP